MIVIDASVTGAMMLDDEPSPPEEIVDRLTVTPLVAPAHWPMEVANLILMAERRRRIAQDDRGYLFARISAMRVGVRRDDERIIWDRAMMLATEHRLTIYDAAYLELAIRLRCHLATIDRDLRTAARARDVTLLTWATP